MDDMTETLAAKSEQLTADDLIGRTLTITITGGKVMSGADQPAMINFEGDNGKPWFPCKTMRRVLTDVWKTPRLSEYVGRSVTLYRDPKVKFGALDVGGIRISHMSHIDSVRTIAVQATKGVKKPYVVQPLKAAQPPAEPTKAALTWFEKISKAAAKAETAEALRTLRARQDVTNAMEAPEAPEDLKAGLASVFRDAEARIATASTDLPDDDGFPGVVTMARCTIGR